MDRAKDLGLAMVSAEGKPTPSHGRSSNERSIADVRMSPDEARELRARLTSFARDRDDPRMAVYDRVT